MKAQTRRPLALPLLALVGLGLGACAHVTTPEDRVLGENYFDQGVLAQENGREQEALSLFRQSIERNPRLPEPHNALGLLLWWSFGDGAQARVEFEKALELRPDFGEAANNLGTLLTELKDYEAAQKAYERALHEPLYRTPFMAQTNLGWLYHLRGKDPEAEQMIRAALTAAPNYCVGHRQLARLLESTGREKEAQPSWERFAELCPNDPEALLRAATVDVQHGDDASAAKKLARCLEKAGARPIAKECRTLLGQLPPAPADATEAPGEDKPGARTLEGAR